MMVSDWLIFEDNTLNGYLGNEADVVIPHGVRAISKGAFYCNPKIETIVIPDSVSQIEPYSFANCKSLKRIVFGSGLKEIPSFLCENDERLSDVVLPSEITTVGRFAFYSCDIEQIVLPQSLRKLEYGCFAENPIKEISLPDGIRFIAGEAFNNSTCREVVVPESVSYLGDRFCNMNCLETLVVQSRDAEPADNKKMWGPQFLAEYFSYEINRVPTVQIFCHPEFVRRLPAFARKRCRPLMYWKGTGIPAVKHQKTKNETVFELKKQYIWRNDNCDMWAFSWKEMMRENPYYKDASERLAWGIVNRNRNKSKISILATFMLSQDGKAFDAHGNEVCVSDHARIRLIHPIELEPEELRDWRHFLLDHSVNQPFVQMFETVYDPKQMDADFHEKMRFSFDKESSPVNAARFEGIAIPALSLMKLKKEHYAFKWDEGAIPAAFGLDGDSQFSNIRLDPFRIKGDRLLSFYEFRPEMTAFKLGSIKAMENHFWKRKRFSPHVNRMIFLLDCLCAEEMIKTGDLSGLRRRREFISPGNINYLIDCAKNGSNKEISAFLETERMLILSNEVNEIPTSEIL